MDFKEAFLNSLKTNYELMKAITIENYLPRSLSTPDYILDNLPFVQAYGDLTTTYPYYYALAGLDSYCFIYSESGYGSLTIQNNVYNLNPNTFAFIDCSTLHRIDIKQSPWRYKIVFIKGDSIPFLYESFIKKREYVHTLIFNSNIPDLLHDFCSSLDKNNDKAYLHSKYIYDILLEVLTEINTQKISSKIPNYLNEIKFNFDTNYDKEYTLDQLEQEYHISKYRLCREFKAHFETSPMQYLNNKRIKIAKEVLTSSDKRINEISRIVGIENPNHFIRLFKQQTGVTPLAYRKKPPV